MSRINVYGDPHMSLVMWRLFPKIVEQGSLPSNFTKIGVLREFKEFWDRIVEVYDYHKARNLLESNARYLLAVEICDELGIKRKEKIMGEDQSGSFFSKSKNLAEKLLDKQALGAEDLEIARMQIEFCRVFRRKATSARKAHTMSWDDDE